MKKLFYLLIAVLLIACKGDEPKVFQIDPLATVNIKPAAGTVMKVKSNVNVEHLTALEIVKQTTVLQFYYNDPIVNQGLVKFERGFDVLQRDTVSATPALKMWSTDIIKIDGKMELAFIESKDCILLKFDLKVAGSKRDTIAYIPNSTLRIAETQIKALYTAENYEAIYELFNNVYTFTPISGAEYKALKAQNLQ